MFQDLRFLWRFNRCRRVEAPWRLPTGDEAAWQSEHEVIGPFGDEARAVAQVGGQQWIVRERDFHGWPDPPRFVFFALQDGSVWAARDFHQWPRAWRLPPARHGEP